VGKERDQKYRDKFEKETQKAARASGFRVWEGEREIVVFLVVVHVGVCDE
jgi:hypothetical protein